MAAATAVAPTERIVSGLVAAHSASAVNVLMGAATEVRSGPAELVQNAQIYGNRGRIPLANGGLSVAWFL